MKRPLLAAVLTAVLSTFLLVPATPADAAVTYVPKAVNGYKVTMSVKTAVGRLKLAKENRYGYERTKFKLWNDVDRDCRNTRAEVLVLESTAKTNKGCTIKYGRWVSAYDGDVIVHASGLDIDHLVPLAEAWDSGARTWSAARRQAYANDLTDPRTLIAVSASANRSKGDRDPAEWLPERNVCNYVKQWVVVKLRWSLTVDPAERALLLKAATNCPQMIFTTHKAKVELITYGSNASHSGGTSGGTGGGGTDPRFSSCRDAIAAGYGPYVRGRDPEYSWYTDRDGDGVVCE